MWVHRLAATESGSPEARITLVEVKNDLREVARAVMRGPRHEFTANGQAEQAHAFLMSELFDRGVLRQGWGAPGMRADHESEFLKGYVIAAWRYWNMIPVSVRDDLRREPSYERIFPILEPFYRQAKGRLRIISRMTAMNRGHIVFLPNVPHRGATFTVARIDDGQYTFDERTCPHPKAFWEVDYGHCRRVRDVRTFQYGDDTVPNAMFGSPYLHAIDPVSARECELRSFLSRHGFS